ncbi:hypothetical protein RCL_jg9601.t1 [Rhizophagus clarus]|uniref:MULE transposase domain-containing protein n=1 Tax=Rhizophagus clarus TaxID=94130 RepID=A0A8H3LYB7_9GLOM|nr:hypothetical protein RCL_jg9601.t1 [Rhizophagus clarus]
MIKRMAQNLLQNHASPSCILDDNINFVTNYLNGKVVIDNERFLLSNQDLINIRNSMTKEIWGNDYDLMEAAVYYKPRRELNDRGIPIRYLLFSASGGAQRSSSSYNYLILKELTSHYKNKLEQEKGWEWEGTVAITDCDHRERRALIEIWPDIHLILCLKEVYQYLRSFTEKLKNTTEPTTFINQIIVETEVFLMNNLNQEKDSKKTSIINGALNFVYYIRDYWCGDLAIGWCIYGRIIAADLLQVSLDQIPKTNNQLESFNSELKVHQLQKYQNNGHLLRFNVLSVDLIKSITPNILLVVFALLNVSIKKKKIIQIEFNEHQSFGLIDEVIKKFGIYQASPLSQDSLHDLEITPTSPNDHEKNTLYS